MNQNQIQQLTIHLSQALDQNYDVVNMEAVLSVICALEGTTITKDQLEATRLAKYINQLRRRTKNEQLARRAKSLLKKWREMVGIQQTNDSQPQPLPHSSQKAIVGPNISESNIVENDVKAHQYSLVPPSTSHTPTQRVIYDLHSNIDSLESHCITDTQQHQTTNFSNFITHININHGEESMVNCKATNKHQRAIEPHKSCMFINEHSSNSVSNLAVGNNDKLLQASIVIDIVSDSDENDSGIQPTSQKEFATSSSALTFPAVYPRPKKLKKEKKRKERGQQSLINIKEGNSQHSKNAYKSTDSNCFPIKEGKGPITYRADSEILSLSNSSMSSILSGDALSGNSQNKVRTTTSDLTFAGRFKSASQMDPSIHDNSSVLASDPKPVCKVNEASNVEQPTRQIYEDYINNDSSTSCSRLSPFEELEAKQSQIHSKSFVDRNKQQIPTFLSLKPHDNHSAEYHENVVSQTPKKRGRKKGSKGVDSVIAKESRLSQQILLGSGAKKVKTTKELFNEIQGRKLNISYNRADTFLPLNNLSNASTLRSRESRSLLTRPTSSCSETSIHSPQILEAYSANISFGGIESKFSNIIEDTGNTDSDTITSEPSRDSTKSGEIKRAPSLDSISNSLQTSSVKTSISKSILLNHNDVTTQLMHLVNSLRSPLSVNDTEKLYQAQIVPCTCVIVEETQNLSTGQSNSVSQLKIETGDLNNIKSNVDYDDYSDQDTKKNEQVSLKIDKSVVDETTFLIPQKAMKSIFDLDFDDDDDPLHSIINNISPAESTSSFQRTIKHDNDNVYDLKSLKKVGLSNEANKIEMQAVVSDNQDEDDSEKVPETLSMYIVDEDPDCVAKRRFTVQTNNVTNYHINALHNYYVPNINGNWNSINSQLFLKSTISEFFKKKNLYEVSDGADVVPKYSSLTYDRIPKDLGYLKFPKNVKRKFLKSRIPPFLGVAKCLPSCRQASKRAKNDLKLSVLKHSELLTKLHPELNVETTNDHSSPLRVDVDTHDNTNKIQKQMQYSDGADNNTTLSCNLLKLVNIKSTALPDDGMITLSRLTSRSSSSCSTSSLIITQNSINKKLRNQRAHTTNTEQIEQNVVERNRKKRRKATKLTEIDTAEHENENTTKPRLKRIKIAINGCVATQRQISLVSSSDDESKNVDGGETRSELNDTEATGYLSTGSGYNNHEKNQTASEDEHEHEHGSFRSHSTTIDSIGADEDGNLENDIENEYDNNSNDEEYAIIQKPIMGGSNNHIVLTIKKTPSKINSPVNSISAISPIVAHSSIGVLKAETEIQTAKYRNFNNINNNNNNSTGSEITAYHQHQFYNLSSLVPISSLTGKTTEYNGVKDTTISHTCLKSFHKCYRYRCRRRYRRPQTHQSCQKETIDIELKHLFNEKNISQTTQPMIKTHRKLFFPNELKIKDNIGRKDRIINYSSSSSNYDDDSEKEQENFSTSSDKTETFKIDFAHNYKLKIETDTSASTARNSAQREDPHLSSSEDESEEILFGNHNNDNDNRDYGTTFETIQNELPLNNNGMLPSFNSIYSKHLLNQNENSILASDVKDVTTLESLQNENCDDVNSICYNNNNLSLIKPHSLGSNTPINNNDNDTNDEQRAAKVIENNSSKVLENNENVNGNLNPHVEYRTGIRTIVEDDPSTSRIQQFKEWHEVLHLQSYNNEPLIVLPYVVLE